MKKGAKEIEADPLDQEWDFSQSIPNPFAGRRIRNFVVIEPELLEVFPNSTAINDALRELIGVREKATAAKVKRASYEVRAKKKRG